MKLHPSFSLGFGAQDMLSLDRGFGRIVQKGYVRFFGSLWAEASQGWRLQNRSEGVCAFFGSLWA